MSAAAEADVIVAGAGNAALCAAAAAAGAGARVTVLEAAKESESGGNSWFTDGAMRFAFDDFAQIRDLLNLSEKEASSVEISPYPADRYLDDLRQAGCEHARDDLLQTLAEESLPTMRWLAGCGVGLELISDNQSHEIGGVRRFFGNLNVRAKGRGIGLVDALKKRCRELGVQFVYGARARKLEIRDGCCEGVGAETSAGDLRFAARAVVLACGGFEADADMRAEHLGEQWRAAAVRGTRHNLGDGIRMALAAGAGRAGFWGGCHAVGTDANMPDGGDFSLPGDIWKKHSYPYGIMVNAAGLRFVDEGADIRNYTYARYGREILSQPGAAAWQIFDAKTEPLLRSEYRHDRAARFSADSLPELAEQIEVDRAQFLRTIEEYNSAVLPGDFDPAVKDGSQTRGLSPEKSNWALPIDEPPFLAFPVKCGITFTFGGIDVDTSAQVRRADGAVIKGLFAAGEMVGGIFGSNYPGGSGLMSGSVFGRIGGVGASAHVGQAG